MQEKPVFKLPLGLLLLDGIGSVLLGLGLAIKFEAVSPPASLNFLEGGLVLIAIGVLLMLPFLIHMATWARTQAEEKNRL